jgi:WbqC-like protein family
VKKSVAIIQSNYIPWKGYFNIIKCVDEFVLLDDVQYTRRDWRNRNLIKTKSGLRWLTVPVLVKGNYHIKIQDVLTDGSDWRTDHWNQIFDAYKAAPHFKEFSSAFEEMYLGSNETILSKINFDFIQLINSILKIETPIRWSSQFDVPKEKSQRLAYICRDLEANVYVSGALAKEYLDIQLFANMGIEVSWVDYSRYTEYEQLYPPFEHGVSIIDLIFNQGPRSCDFLKEKVWT